MRLPADTVTVTSAPGSEPITTADMKDHLRVDISDDDDYIGALITAARVTAENTSWRKFITQTLAGGLMRWPGDNVITLPWLPVQSVTSIAYVDDDGNNNTVDSSVYGLDTKRGLIYLNDDQEWPTTALRTYDPITVTWVAGYGNDVEDVPAPYVHAMRLLVGHWYENREQVVALAGISMAELPLAAQWLLSMDKAH